MAGRGAPSAPAGDSGRGPARRPAVSRAFAASRLASLVSSLAAGIALLAAGCAYYNTFYFAKRYYDQAERLVQAAGSDKLPPDAARKYDDSIKQSGKVIRNHGGSRWVDDALYLMGAAYAGKRDFEEALRKFDELVANYPESKFVPWALYRSGLCHFERKNFEQMETYFRRVLDGYPKFERRDDILFTLARSAEQQRDRPRAVRGYRALVREFPRSARSAEGLSRIGDLYFDAGYADSAYASYVEMGRLARDDETWRRAQLKVADALVRMGRPEEAVRELGALLPKNEPAEGARTAETWPAEVYLGLARAYNAGGRPLEALTALRRVTKSYASSSFSPEAQFQIGYTYEAYLDSLDAARAAYDQVGRLSASSVFREQAQQRSRNLQQLQALATEARADSATDRDRAAEAELRIAELYLLSQNKVEEALRQYRQVQAQYPESRVAPRAAYAVAWTMLRRVEGKRDSALAGFVDLVHRYPDSPAARGAIDLLAAEGADTTGLARLLVAMAPESLAAVAPLPSGGAQGDAVASPANGGAPESSPVRYSPPPGSEGPPPDSLPPPWPEKEDEDEAGEGRRMEP